APTARAAERGVRGLPAVSLVADDVLGRNLDVGEEDLGELGAAGDLLQRAYLDALRAHVEDEVRDALVLGHVRFRARQQDAEGGVCPEAGPDFLAVDRPVIALAYGARLQTGQVRA